MYFFLSKYCKLKTSFVANEVTKIRLKGTSAPWRCCVRMESHSLAAISRPNFAASKHHARVCQMSA